MNQIYDLGISRTKSQYLLYIIAIFDIFGCVVMILFFCSEKYAEEEEITFFKQKQFSLNDFSLKIKGFKLESVEEELN